MKRHTWRNISIFVLINPGQVRNSSYSSIVSILWLQLPLTQIKADSKIRKNNLHRMVEIIFSYLSPVLTDVLMKHWTLLSHIPKIKKNLNRVKVLCWMFIIRLLQFRFFSCSCFFRTLSFVKWIYDGEWVSVTITSKKAFWSALHRSLAVISGLEAFPDSPSIVSRVTGWNSG